ncbi:MAG: S1C family serine protease [Allobaculum sp.]
MSTTTPPKAPHTNKSRRPMRNSTAIAIVSAIGISTVLLSGGAAYAGTRMAQHQMTETPTLIEQAPNNNTNTRPSSNINITAMDVSDVVAKLRPSVVEIATESVSSGNSIFGQYISQGAGSGVIYSADGYIITNNHVIDGASSITVKTMDGTEYPATLIGTDPQTDIAVIKIDATNLTPAAIGDSEAIQVGEATIAIGNPLGSLGGTVTTGIISAVGREITINNETMTLLQTDAAINPGNSGGGLFDVSGNLIGIVNAKNASSEIEGLGFAIPISDVTNVIQELIENGRVTSRPVLNVTLQQVSDAAYFGQSSDLQPGVYIVQVVEGGTADRSGLKVGDRILSFDGQEITQSNEVKQILKKHAIGDQVEMVIERDGKQQTVVVDLENNEVSEQTKNMSY